MKSNKPPPFLKWVIVMKKILNKWCGKLTYTSGEGVSEYYLSSSHAKQVHESMARDRPN